MAKANGHSGQFFEGSKFEVKEDTSVVVTITGGK